MALLASSELVNVYDASYAGEIIRFNPTLKWWGWIFTGGVFSISAFLLAGSSRPGRLVAVAVLVLIPTFVIDTGRLFAFAPAPPWKLDGGGFYAREVSTRA